MTDGLTDEAPGEVTTAVLDDWVRRFAGLVAEHRDELTALDSAIGDADHGTNMDRGMKAVVSAPWTRPSRPRRRRCSPRSG